MAWTTIVANPGGSTPPGSDPPGDTPHGTTIPPAPKKRNGQWVNVLIVVVAIVGLLVASYPSIAQWVTSVQRADTVTGYTKEMESVNGADREAQLEAARRYNNSMPEVLLTDPYSRKEASEGAGGAWEEYQRQLRVPNSQVMGRISIPAIETNLSIYHGTDSRTLSLGAGHLFGASLPVGGESAHAVITAHTAYTQARLFDDLNKVKEGDEFFITVAGERLAYRVDQIKTVLPAEVSELKVVDGKDYVTLVTCAPPTVNTHRLLVRGERIPLENAELKDEAIIDHTVVGFPWWIVWLTAGGLLITALAIWVFRPDCFRRVLARMRAVRGRRFRA